ncbi:Transposase [Marinobacter sp. LV10R510-11A]|uniref:IS1595 family transposase n=1 Tax=Marinobacter sp. LV10R510-11A TaxID=1415568 RepID=UPI000BB71F40|nr:IS1595 family transposase [Marinobacter sp. LV10R510-11A]SOB74717.1 Transposase [Marinobacter sp. LV10R510-11A]
MKRANITAIEKTLANLPVDLKKYLADQLLGQINAQAHALLETATSHRSCPHCSSQYFVKWGYSAGLQRYRCQNPVCHKTFNAVSRTPLARLRHRDKWFDYLRCMRDSLTLRVSAARVGIDLKTAFRWRHRFLLASAHANANDLSGIIEVDETFFAESCKGKRKLTHRSPRKRGGQSNRKYKADKIPVLIARDRNGHISDLVDPALNKSTVHEFLTPIINCDSILCSDGHSWYKTFSKDHGIAHHRLITLDNQRVIGKEYHIQNVNSYISRLKGWMARFHGVGTAYLPSYLAWRRLFESEQPSEEAWLRTAISANQQRKPT